MLDPVDVISFDAGGTLLFPYPSVGIIYAEVMDRHGIHSDPETLNSAFETTIRQAMKESQTTSSDRDWWREVVRRTMAHLGEPDNFDAMFDDLWNEFAHPRRWRLIDDARETLHALRERGYRLAIISNWDDRLRPLLDRMDLVDFFDELVISCEVGVEKPSPAIFAAAQARLDAMPARILHVGDSLRHDIQGARAAGWQTLLLDPEGKHPDAKPRAKTLTDLLDLLPQ